MIEAFVLVVVKPGNEEKVYEALRGQEKIKEMYRVYGEYDLILREAEKYGEIRHHFFAVVEGKFRDVYAINEPVWVEV
jgi:ribosome biogenesis protein Nip4